jgi:hypothetical protein|tara:strand:+ start:1043 stop:1306 length:264 start_codon:yes stop_codon:yes gene_type:complete
MFNKLTPTDPTIEATVQRIETYGGGFAQKLMAAYRTADMSNRQRIIDAFEEYFEEYGPNGIFASKDSSIHSMGYAMVKHLQIRKQIN